LFSSNNLDRIKMKKYPYNSAIGLKIGTIFKVDFKSFITPDISIGFSSGKHLIENEGILSTIVVLYHHDTHLPNFYWFYGGGLASVLSQTSPKIGMAFSLGFEAVTNDNQTNFFVDFQPIAYYPFNRNQVFSTSNFRSLSFLFSVGAGVRYIISS